MADDAMTETKPLDWIALADGVAAQLAEAAPRHDADDSFVADGYALLKRKGLFKAHVPAELGGGGASYAEICDVVRTLAKGCGSTGLAFSMHTHLVALAVWRWRNEGAPTDGLLKRVAAEDLILVSSGRGSDWLTSAGTAVKAEGGFRITARKIFSSGSPAGDLLMTSAVHDDPDAGPDRAALRRVAEGRGRDDPRDLAGHGPCAAPARTTSSSTRFSSPTQRSPAAACRGSGTRCSMPSA